MSGGVDRRGERRGYKAWRYYKCDRKRREGNAVCADQHHVGADKLEQRVIQIVLERILTPEHVAHICAEMQERLGGGRLEEEIADLDGRIAGLRRSLAHLLDIVEQGDWPLSPWANASPRGRPSSPGWRLSAPKKKGASRPLPRHWRRKNLRLYWLLCVRA